MLFEGKSAREEIMSIYQDVNAALTFRDLMCHFHGDVEYRAKGNPQSLPMRSCFFNKLPTRKTTYEPLWTSGLDGDE